MNAIVNSSFISCIFVLNEYWNPAIKQGIGKFSGLHEHTEAQKEYQGCHDSLESKSKRRLSDAINAATGWLYANANADAFNTDSVANGAAYMAGLNLTDIDTGAVGGLNADGGAIRTAESVISDTSTRSGENSMSGFNEIWGKIEDRCTVKSP